MSNKVKRIDYAVKDIKALPNGWSLLSETTNKESRFYLSENIKKQLAIVRLPPDSMLTENDYEILLFIGTKSALVSSEFREISNAVKEKYNTAYIPVGNLKDPSAKIISECYDHFKNISTAAEEYRDISALDPNNEDFETLNNINQMFYLAAKAGASDIHLEVVSEYTNIRVRVDGSIDNLYETALAASTGTAIASVIYRTLSLSGSVDFNPKTQQDSVASGVFGYGDDKYKLKIRVATNPTINGFDMVMRLIHIKEDSSYMSLDQIYSPKLAKQVQDAVNESEGLVIISGTTGSGKSTSLQNIILSVLKENSNRIKVITIEDPPENIIKNTSQVPVVRDASGSGSEGFNKAIKAAMRSDPDIIMIGEIRDQQTALLAVQAVQSGHKTYSTIHTDSAITIIKRLEVLGVTKDILATPKFISALVYQKLVPVLCKHCSIDYNTEGVPNKLSMKNFLSDNKVCTLDEFEVYNKKAGSRNIIRYLQDIGVIRSSKQAEKLMIEYDSLNSEEQKQQLIKRMTDNFGDLTKHNIRFQGNGCKNCKNGIKGRTVIAEVVRPDFEMLKLIEKGANAEITEHWRRKLGGKYAQENAYEKILTGELSPYDVERIFSPIGRKIL